MKHLFLMIFLLVVFPLTSRSDQRISTPELRKLLVGTWEVFKLPPARHLEGPLAFDPAPQLGKKIVFSRDSFDYDREFMFFPETCRRARYAVHIDPIPSGSIPSQGSLNFGVPPDSPEDFGPVRADEAIAVRLECGEKEMTVLDFSSGGFLAIYWETGFFYLKKKASSSRAAIDHSHAHVVGGRFPSRRIFLLHRQGERPQAFDIDTGGRSRPIHSKYWRNMHGGHTTSLRRHLT